MDAGPRVCKFSGLRASGRTQLEVFFGLHRGEGFMKANSNRREFLRATALTGAGLALSNPLLGASNKSVLVFTKSSGFEHAVVKRADGKPSLVDDTINELGNEHVFSAVVTNDGRIFASKA